MKILIASNNKKKLVEIKEHLEDLDVEIVTPSDLGIDLEVEEDGKTFEENAIKKAKEFAEKSGLISLADDSGLEVDYLNGEPGVYSVRWHDGTDHDRNKALLKRLEGVEEDKRGASFVCAMAVVIPEGESKVFRGSYRGIITEEPIGENDFGYDPIFYIPDLKRTAAEITLEKKNKISHRGIALEKIKPVLKRLIEGKIS